MSITDELRECIRTANRSYEDARNPYNDREILRIPEEELTAIADRIDAEHAEAVADALQLRGGPDRWVELPVDADGVPIKVGDVMEWPDGSTFDVVGISANTLFYVEHDFDDSAQWTAAHNKRHHQLDSWERIIKDALTADRGDAYAVSTGMMCELVERCRRLAHDGR